MKENSIKGKKKIIDEINLDDILIESIINKNICIPIIYLDMKSILKQDINLNHSEKLIFYMCSIVTYTNKKEK